MRHKVGDAKILEIKRINVKVLIKINQLELNKSNGRNEVLERIIKNVISYLKELKLKLITV